MKSKFFKLVMPVMVFMVAIAFAFASDNSTAPDSSLAFQGYVYKNNICQISRFCDNNGGAVCEDAEGLTVYQLQTTTCSLPMTHRL